MTKYLYFTLLLATIILIAVFNRKPEEIHVEKLILLNKLDETPPIITSVFKQPELYNNTIPAVKIHDELVRLAIQKDPNASMKLVSINSICKIAALGEDVINDVITGIGSVLLNDKSGRYFFNQSLMFTNADIKSIDDIYDMYTDNTEYCTDFESDTYDQLFKYLKIGALHGNNNARISLWQMDDPVYFKHKANYYKNKNNLEYLKFYEKEYQWKETRKEYLYAAAHSGDSRAWVLLGDALSSYENIPPNLEEAYKYYYAASKIYDLPFIFDRLELLEQYIDVDDIDTLKESGQTLFDNH